MPSEESAMEAEESGGNCSKGLPFDALVVVKDTEGESLFGATPGTARNVKLFRKNHGRPNASGVAGGDLSLVIGGSDLVSYPRRNQEPVQDEDVQNENDSESLFVASAPRVRHLGAPHRRAEANRTGGRDDVERTTAKKREMDSRKENNAIMAKTRRRAVANDLGATSLFWIMDASVGMFVDVYAKIHGPLVLSLCFFGVSSNVANIRVLTQRRMISPTNILLTGLSASQLLLLINYLIYTVYVIFDTPCNRDTKTFGWLSYLLLNVNLNLVFHTISLVHTTMLAVFRYAAVAFPTRTSFISVLAAKRAVTAAFVAVPVVCSTFYPNSIVIERNSSDSSECPAWRSIDNRAIYSLRYSDRKILRDYNFWFFGTVCKILPCLLLVFLSAFLIRELSRVRRRRERLQKSSTAERNHRQITVVLVCIVLLFVAVELPQGVMNMLSAILKDEFIDIYTSLGDFFEMLTVLYSSVNFILYCSMSSQFRSTFKISFVAPIFRLCGCRRLAASFAAASRPMSKASAVTENIQIRAPPDTKLTLLDTGV